MTDVAREARGSAGAERAAAARTYQMEELRQKRFLLIAAVIAGFAVLWPVFVVMVLGSLGVELLDLLIVVLPTALLLGFAFFVARLARTIRLELSQTGIMLHLPLAGQFAADWSAIERIAPAPWGLLSGEALIPRRPPRVRRGLLYPFLSTDWLDRAIPLAPFALPLGGSHLEADLRARLPQLFD